jgi:Tol biopolymer transport system component
VGSDDGKEAFVAIYELAGTSALRRLTFEGHNRFPVWSADGQRVAFQSDREGDLAIFSQRADGTGPVERLTKPEQGASHVPEAWSPDGKALLFSSFKDVAFTLWVLSAEDKNVMPFGDVKSPEPIASVFSPDGRWVAYATNFSAAGGAYSPNGGVYVQPFPASGARYQVPKTARDFHPVWAPDGKTLFYVPSSVQFAAVSVTTQPSLSFATPAKLPPAFMADNRRSIDVRGYDIMPDGRFIGLVGADATGASTASELRIIINWFEELKRVVPTK